ncbi:bacteriocin immunity protein [Vibrio parahaemolyticus]|nr:bacteriocin immunity protein [Vibrio parahaemolyticus]
MEEFFEDTYTNDLDDEAYDLHISNLSAHFSELVSHPDGNALIFHPSQGR